MRLLALGLLSCSLCRAASWELSVGWVSGSAALDLVSSQGRHEMNPVVRGSNGLVSPHKKLAITGGFLVGGWLIQKRWPHTRPFITKMNWAFGAVTLAGPLHNFSTR